jgi:predicted HicB family RNase H-like nuclease
LKRLKPSEAQIVIRIEPKEKLRLTEEAKREGLSLSAYVRRVLLGLQERPEK